ncbi:MAG: PAC2 family protein [Actinobacteria bacterium]|nr:PAC2 family protein [Actinomycetota bacterium]
MIEVTQEVPLDAPVVVVALSGWVDAGTAGEAAARYLAEHIDGGRELARVDLAEIADLQATRPTIELIDGVTRNVIWPAVTFTAGRAGRDVIVCQGPEPSLRWKAFAGEVVDLARRFGAPMVVTLGGMPSPVSHRRPMGVLATASSRSTAQEVNPVRLDYSGPTGAQTVVQVTAGEAGISAVGLWAQVPHYLSGTVSPVAVRALLSRLRDVARVDVDLSPLDQEASSYHEQVEATVQARPDLAELVSGLDAQAQEIPTGDELASEIEEFLRREG